MVRTLYTSFISILNISFLLSSLGIPPFHLFFACWLIMGHSLYVFSLYWFILKFNLNFWICTSKNIEYRRWVREQYSLQWFLSKNQVNDIQFLKILTFCHYPLQRNILVDLLRILVFKVKKFAVIDYGHKYISHDYHWSSIFHWSKQVISINLHLRQIYYQDNKILYSWKFLWIRQQMTPNWYCRYRTCLRRLMPAFGF